MEKVYDVAPEVKAADQWLMPYLSTLNPETDYERIISIFAQYNLDTFALQYVVSAGTIHNIQKPEGAETLAYTGKIVRRPNRRNTDGLGFFWTWFAMGPSHPDAQASIKRLNDIHNKVAAMLPGNFSANDDFLYTLCVIGTLQDRIMESLGLPSAPPFIKIAMHHVLRDIAVQFTTEDGTPVFDFPTDYQGMVDFTERYDSQTWGPATEAHRSVTLAMIEDFATRFFPPHLVWLGRNFVKYAVKDKLLDYYGVSKLTPEENELTAGVLRSMYIEKFSGPDNKVSFLDTYVPMTNEAVLEADKQWAAKADEHGWLKGGKETLAATRS